MPSPDGSSLTATSLSFARDLPPVTRAALLMAAASVMFAAMNAIIRLCSAELPPIELAFFRNFFALLVMLPWIAHYGLNSMRTQRIKLYSIRALLGMVSMFCWFTAVTMIPLAEATALSFTGPIFATAGAAIILRETVGWRRWSAVAVGFIGVLIVLRPGSMEFSLGAGLALTSALMAAAGMLMVKSLSRTEPTPAIVAYMVIYLVPMSLIPALFVWVWPSPGTWPYLVILGVFGAGAHICLTRGLAAAETSVVMPFDYLRMPCIAVMAYLMFGEIPTIWTWLGAGVICMSALYIAHREYVRRHINTRPEVVPH